MKVLIIGAGGHGQVVANIIQARQQCGHNTLQPIGYLDDDPTLHSYSFLGLPVLGPVASLSGVEHDAVIVAIGDNVIRQKICRKLAEAGEQLVTAIHPTAIIGAEVEICPGTMICAGAIVSTGTRVGRGVILNTACTVDHHNCLGDYAHIAPGAHLGGHVTIGQGALVGIGAAIIPRNSVGDWAIVGAGAVVTRDVPAKATAIGVPAHLKVIEPLPLMIGI
ncbi:MAG: acetyltransferase [Anaerolineae bacterium]|nr:acetyltransferase [Anaerolineae bacterium]